MRIVVTRLSELMLPLAFGDDPHQDIASHMRAMQLGLYEGMPLLLHEDGSFDTDLNEWLHSLPAQGATSTHTWMAYARDVSAWVSFFAKLKHGLSWTLASTDDLARYRSYRLEPARDAARDALSAHSWNRIVASLDSLYGWAEDTGRIAQSPLRRIERAVRRDGGPPFIVRCNPLRSTHYDEERRTNFVRRQEYRTFIDVGLRMMSTDGVEDPRRNAGRHAHRNVVLADLLYLSGLRIEEATGILEWELPTRAALAQSQPRQGVPWRVARGIAKGRKPRTVIVSQRALRQLRGYADVERANLIARFRRPDGTYVGIPEPILVRRAHDATNFTFVGRSSLRAIDVAEIDVRRRMVEVMEDGTQSPVALWIGERGAPLAPKSWEDTFTRAEARCGVYVRPHMLRHTYAINLLSALIEATFDSIARSDESSKRGNGYGQFVRRVYSEPLNIVRRQLGHASITQTHHYLDDLSEAQRLIDEAVARLHGDDDCIPWDDVRRYVKSAEAALAADE